MARIFSIFPLIGLISLACAACQPNQAVTPNTQTSTTTQTQSKSAAQQIDINPLPPSQPYALQVNGDQVWAKLTQISYAEDSIIVNLAITNGSRQVIQLNAQDNMFLEDNGSYEGYKYNLSPPPDNPTIAIQPGTTMKGQFVFIGRLSPAATKLGLNINNVYEKKPNNPNLSIADIPVLRGINRNDKAN